MSLYKVAVRLLSGFFKLIYNLRIHDPENVPSDGSYIVVCNHISMGDVIILAISCRLQIHFMAKKELFRIPLLSQLLSALGAFPVDRTGSAAAALKKTAAYLEDGKTVGIFPQGTRQRGKSVEDTEFKTGAAFIAFKAHAGIIPAFIKAKKQRFKLFGRSEIFFGKPIEYGEFNFSEGGRDEYAAATQKIKDAVFSLEKKAYGGKYNV